MHFTVKKVTYYIRSSRIYLLNKFNLFFKKNSLLVMQTKRFLLRESVAGCGRL